MPSQFLVDLKATFSASANQEIALKQSAYMRNQFDFYGLMSQKRRELSKPFLSTALYPQKQELSPMVQSLWKEPQRELQYFGQELCAKYKRHLEAEDIELYEFMITSKSWWDTVDFIAANLVGAYFQKYPEKIPEFMDKWLASENIWLQRTCLIFQLKYKGNTDHELLGTLIQSLNGTNEFFINKAIGWALREYGKTNPNWVEDFVRENKLNTLSKKEALRLLKI